MVDIRVQERAMNDDPNGSGIMRFTSSSKLQNIEKHVLSEDAQKKQNMPEIINLASHIRKAWVRNRNAKQQGVETQMINALLQCKGEYDPITKHLIKDQGGSDVFVNVTSVKCRATEAWLYDIMLPAGERPWSLEATTLPDLEDDIEQEIGMRISDEYMQQLAAGVQLGTMSQNDIPDMIERMKAEILQAVKDRAKKDATEMENEIEDELIEGGFYDAMRKFIPDVVRLPAGILHGPVVYRKKMLEWYTYPDGTPYANVIYKPIRHYRRVNPFDMYPSPGATSLDDGDLIERIPLSRQDLVGYLGSPGFDDDAIRLVLQEYGQGGLHEWLTNDLERMEAENRPVYGTWLNQESNIDCLKYMGSVSGTMLRQWGMTEEQIPDPIAEYDVTAYLIGRYVIKAKLNDDPLGKRNYWSTSFEKSNDSVWGRGIPQLMEDIQRICNGCARAIINNMAHASGPQVWFYANLVNGTPPAGIRPWQMWPMKTDPAIQGQRAPMGFFQPNIIVDQLLKIFEYFFKMASEVTGVPSYIYGSDRNQGGASDTASGLSMLMNAASKGLKAVAGHVDHDVTTQAVYAHWLHIMLNEPERAKGDINVVARASEYILQQEQLQMRRNEFLKSTNNPTDMAIIGNEGRAELLRESVKGLKMDTHKIIPDRMDLINMKEQNEMTGVLQNIANAVGLPIEQVAQIAKTGGVVGGPGPGGNKKALPEPKALGPDGQPAGGRDVRVMG